MPSELNILDRMPGGDQTIPSDEELIALADRIHRAGGTQSGYAFGWTAVYQPEGATGFGPHWAHLLIGMPGTFVAMVVWRDGVRELVRTDIRPGE